MLTPRTLLGPYEVVGLLGAGGMGEVYRARDTRLGRDVAVKVLPAHVAATPELRERFEREARTVASLNHPNICTLHDVGRQVPAAGSGQAAVDYLVMELLEGESLAERLARGALPLDEALQYAMQISSALDTAHRAGITHRDLKPGNVFLVRGAGGAGAPTVKLLDFGLAKHRSPAVTAMAGGSLAPTQAAPLTAHGSIVGTLQYMAPEQLEGAEIDARTDIFAFGAVLYEMLTGRRAFEAKSQVSLIAAIVDQDPPPVSSAQPIAPPLLDQLVKTCLAKKPDLRWQHAGDVFLQLRLIADGGAVAPAAVRGRTGAAWIPWAAAGALLVATAALATAWLRAPAPPQPPRITFTIDTSTAPSPLQLAVSPDGTRIAASMANEEGVEQIWVRSLDSLEGRLLPRTENHQFPFWAPDGQTLGFFADGRLKKIDLTGGPSQAIVAAPVGHGGTWNAAGTIVFAPDALGPLYRVSASGGDRTPITALDGGAGELAHRHPFFLPDGDHFLYTSINRRPEISAIYLASLSPGTPKRLLASAQKAAFASGHILFVRDAALMAQRFDTDRLDLAGEPFLVAEDIGINIENSVAGFSASMTGLLAVRTGTGSLRRVLAWFDPSGKALGAVSGVADYANPALSPDGRRIAVGRGEAALTGGAEDIWIYEVGRTTWSRFTFDAGDDTAPAWSPDGRSLIFSSSRDDGMSLYVKEVGGTSPERVLIKSGQPKYAEDWSSDGRQLLYRQQDPKTGWDLWLAPLDDPSKARPLVQTPFGEIQGRLSPDGRFFAYASNESGRYQVYVQTVAPPGARWQISTSGGYQPRWRSDGRALYFLGLNRDAVMVPVGVSANGAIEAGTPASLFPSFPSSLASQRNSWDVSRDGQRFLITIPESAQGGRTPPIGVIVNWLSPPGR
jgi:Tol biopolymer transport system component/tRNA A-37 threonylcarbamoyl transferase component Bud32